MGRPHSDLGSERPPAKKFKSDQEPNVPIDMSAVLDEHKEDDQQPVQRADAANSSHGSLKDKEEISSSLHESSRRAANKSKKRKSNETQLGSLKEVESITKNKLLLLKTYADYIKETLKNACSIADMSELIYKMTKISTECGIVTKLVKDLIPHMEASIFPAKQIDYELIGIADLIDKELTDCKGQANNIIEHYQRKELATCVFLMNFM
eukprot:TRINITY_DN5551_c0_g1_i4.p1 TRINITY_DN5551_c0_g1~~TRINITY_DN5551_c0_g1_i4.p1  ORF type:complete len:209 (-),score=41.81 TRINITY_DN5551_c0_g1_i4:137-763(-)